MSKELRALTNGVFTLAETENENQFYFYRNDGMVLNDVGRKPMDFYQEYIARRMMNGEITDMVISNICFETSEDGKCIRLTILEKDEAEVPSANEELEGDQPEMEKQEQISKFLQLINRVIKKKEGEEDSGLNFLRRMLKKFFGESLN